MTAEKVRRVVMGADTSAKRLIRFQYTMSNAATRLYRKGYLGGKHTENIRKRGVAEEAAKQRLMKMLPQG
jgi:hypothetical protein